MALSLLLAEGLLRVFLFSDFAKINALRKPELYARYSSDDDYWRLLSRFTPQWLPNKKRIHPLLGWSPYIVTRENPLGLYPEDLDGIRSRKNRVLFYGDSFVTGMADHDYWIPTYLTNHLLKKTAVVNLAAGGYGLDQIFLMFALSHRMVSNPYIVIGVFPEDIDRDMLSVRTYQKPYFVVHDGGLKLRGLPIDRDPGHYRMNNQPRIWSYLFSFFIQKFRGEDVSSEAEISSKKKIASKLMEKFQEKTRRKNMPILFVLFCGEGHLRVVPWETEFLKAKLTELKIHFIDTQALLRAYADDHRLEYGAFYRQGDSHHNNLGNKVIAEGIARYLKAEGMN